MNCPKCGKEMKEGYLCAKPPVLWTPTKDKLTILKGKNDVYLKGSFREYIGGHSIEDPVAWICEDCRKVIVDY